MTAPAAVTSAVTSAVTDAGPAAERMTRMGSGRGVGMGTERETEREAPTEGATGRSVRCVHAGLPNDSRRLPVATPWARHGVQNTHGVVKPSRALVVYEGCNEARVALLPSWR